jgi:predicted metal-dependent HD superfamily phosphohydrolase
MRSVVGRQRDDRAPGHAQRELQDVPHSRATEAIQALVLITDDAQVPRPVGELEQQSLLDMVCVLVLVDEDVPDLARD